MVWQKKRMDTKNRFLHIVNEHQEILCQPESHQARFRHQPSHQLWLDEVFLTRQQLQGATTIGLGFWDEESGCTAVQSGPRSMNGHRLDVPIPQAGSPTTSLAKEQSDTLSR